MQLCFPRNCLTAHPYANARFPACLIARLKRAEFEITSESWNNSSSYSPGRHRTPPGASSTRPPSTATSSSRRSFCRMTPARAYSLRCRACHARRRTRRRPVSHVTFSSFSEKSLIVSAEIPRCDSQRAREVTTRRATRPFSSRTYALADALVPRSSLGNRLGKHGRDEEDRWRVLDWRNNDCARRATPRDAQMFGFLVGMEVAVVAIPSSSDLLYTRCGHSCLRIQYSCWMVAGTVVRGRYGASKWLAIAISDVSARYLACCKLGLALS